MSKITAERFAALLATARAKLQASNPAVAEHISKMQGVMTENKPDEVVLPPGVDNTVESVTDFVSDMKQEVVSSKIGVERDIQLNEKQQLFCDTVLSGKSCVMIGAAGTGKTTSMRKTTRMMIDSENYGKLEFSTKQLTVGSPGIAVLSYTRKAVANIRRAVVPELKRNTMTIHKILEFEPVFYEIEDPARPGFWKNTMQFQPVRTALNPLPVSLKAIIFEESSMIGCDLHKMLMDAMPHKPQVVYLGDIQQLPPVFGLAILGFKMVELPVIELTEVYRQALASPILSLAWKLLEGDPLPFFPAKEEVVVNGKKRTQVPALEALSFTANTAGEGEPEQLSTVKFQIWQKPLTIDHALSAMQGQIIQWIENGYYNPTEDVILCPFNKSFGTLELNKMISNYLGAKRNADIFHIIAGFNHHYLAVGDRVLYDKEDCFITSIKANPAYMGKLPTPHSTALDRDGMLSRKLTQSEEYLQKQNMEEIQDYTLEELDAMMAQTASLDDSARVQAASHIIHVCYAHTLPDNTNYDELEAEEGDEILSAAADVNNLTGGYALTIHKFQGSEARKVFLIMHHTHGMMNSRELLYTAVTRAREHLHIVCETDTFYKGIKSQAIKGNTIEEKATFFRGKLKKEEYDAKRAADQEKMKW